MRRGGQVAPGSCRFGVRTKPGINMGPRQECQWFRLPNEGRIGPEGWPSSQESPCQSVVGQRQRVARCSLPFQYGLTKIFSQPTWYSNLFWLPAGNNVFQATLSREKKIRIVVWKTLKTLLHKKKLNKTRTFAFDGMPLSKKKKEKTLFVTFPQSNLDLEPYLNCTWISQQVWFLQWTVLTDDT